MAAYQMLGPYCHASVELGLVRIMVSVKARSKVGLERCHVSGSRLIVKVS